MQIKLLTEAGDDNYKKIRLEALRNSPESFGSSYEEEMNAPLKDWRKNGETIFGAFIDNELVAIAGLFIFKMKKMSHKGNLFGLYVKPEYRGKYIADSLIENIINHAKTKVIQLHLTCTTTNQAAVSLYKKHGFKIYGTEARALKLEAQFFDEYLMVLEFDNDNK